MVVFCGQEVPLDPWLYWTFRSEEGFCGWADKVLHTLSQCLSYLNNPGMNLAGNKICFKSGIGLGCLVLRSVIGSFHVFAHVNFHQLLVSTGEMLIKSLYYSTSSSWITRWLKDAKQQLNKPTPRDNILIWTMTSFLLVVKNNSSLVCLWNMK